MNIYQEGIDNRFNSLDNFLDFVEFFFGDASLEKSDNDYVLTLYFDDEPNKIFTGTLREIDDQLKNEYE